MNHLERTIAFRELHERRGCFIMPNPWDVGTARLFAGAGFPALASSSMGYAFSRGKRDGGLSRDEVLAHVAELVAATPLPVNADLENGFGDDPATVATTIAMCIETGASGGSIEDASGRPDDPIYPLDLSVARVEAAVKAAKRADVPFVVTARAENFLHDRCDLDDTIARLRAYQEVGADVLYAPGITTEAEIRAVIDAIDRPLNVLTGLSGMTLSRDALAALGVTRVSLGSAPFRFAMGELLGAAREMARDGTFGFVDRAAGSGALIEALDL